MTHLDAACQLYRALEQLQSWSWSLPFPYRESDVWKAADRALKECRVSRAADIRREYSEMEE